MYLSEEQIINIITEYVSDKRYTQAVLIDGDWGSGKTFFVKGKLCDELENNISKKELSQKIIYVSLYGVESSKEIMEQIYSLLMEYFIDKKIRKDTREKMQRGINFASKILSVGLKHFDIDKSELPKITELQKFENIILIFDDLERCSMPINQVLGFINNLVEHNNIKVIIVANEAEIGKIELMKNLEHKYSVVLNENLNINNNKPINKNELIKCTEELFENNISYKKIKEKLIGTTIHYQSNLNNIYESIVEEYINDSDTKNYLLSKKEVVLDIFGNKKYSNIRTLIFSIIAFEKIALLIKKIEFNPTKYIDKHKDNILKYCIVLSIHLKSGNKPYSWDRTQRIINAGRITLNDDYLHGKRIFAYKFVDDYLLYRSFDHKEIKELLIKLMESDKEIDDYNELNDSLSYYDLQRWYMLEDTEIREKLNNILDELKNEKYNSRYFKDIIIILMQLKENGFNCINYDNYIDKMKKYIEKRLEDCDEKNLKLLTEWLQPLSEDKDFLDDYNEIIVSLINIIEKREKEQKIAVINERLYGKGWGENFCSYCYDNRQQILDDKKFFACIDINKMIEKIKNSNVKDLYGLLSGIKEVYKSVNINEFFKEDISNLNIIINLLDVDKLSDNKITKKIVLEKIKDKLQQSLSRIEQEYY